MFDINYELKKEGVYTKVYRDDEEIDSFDVITDLQMIPKLLRALALAQGKLKITPELDAERNDILAWLMVYHK